MTDNHTPPVELSVADVERMDLKPFQHRRVKALKVRAVLVEKPVQVESYEGRLVGAQPGDYLVIDEDGILSAYMPEGFDQAYREIKPRKKTTKKKTTQKKTTAHRKPVIEEL